MGNAFVVIGVLMPHPPIAVAGVGRGQEDMMASTVNAMRAVAVRVTESTADTLVLISPHSPRRPGAFGIWESPRIAGSLTAFGAPTASVDLERDGLFADSLQQELNRLGRRTWPISGVPTDHGALVPLLFLVEAGWRKPVAIVGLSRPGGTGLRELGTAISAAASRLRRRIALVASGDMSHRLTASAPCGYHPRAPEFDDNFVTLLRAGADGKLGDIDAELLEAAGEDVVDSTVAALAAIGEHPAGRRVLSYEGPFGVGYCVAVLHDAEARERADRSPEISAVTDREA